MSARVLLWDIETAPMKVYAWDLYDQNIALNQIETDWHVLAWAAKWLGEEKVMYEDQRNSRPIQDDKRILKILWKLLDEADIVITQNGKRFDAKKVNARFIHHGFQPPSSYRHIDTLQLAKKHFGFTSNKLAYMTDKLNVKYKKLEHGKFPGFTLWQECLKGNFNAWREMELYNKHDVLSLEELYTKLIPWDSTINFNSYHDKAIEVCTCGSNEWFNNGHCYTSTGKYKRYRCKNCGSEGRDSKNILEKKLLRKTR